MNNHTLKKYLLNLALKAGFLSLFCALSCVLTAQEITLPPQYLINYDLSDDWQVYDNKYKSYVPYIAKRHGNSKSMGFWLIPSNFERQYLVIFVAADSYFFINQKLTAHFKENKWVQYSLDSLAAVHGKAPLFCTFYDDKRRLPYERLSIAYLKPVKQTSSTSFFEEKTETFKLHPRSSQSYKYVLVVSFCLGLIGLAFLLNYSPKSFWSYFSLRSSLSSLAQKDNNLIHKPINTFNAIFILVISIWLGIYFEFFFGVAQRNATYSGENNWFSNPWSLQILLIVGINVLFLLKYSGLSFFGLLLNIPKEVMHIHFFEYLRILSIYYLTAGLCILALIGGFEYLFGEYFIEVMLYFTLTFHISQAFLIVYFIIKQLTFRSMYLFYYLCITELVPILIGAKLLVFNIYD